MTDTKDHGSENTILEYLLIKRSWIFVLRKRERETFGFCFVHTVVAPLIEM